MWRPCNQGAGTQQFFIRNIPNNEQEDSLPRHLMGKIFKRNISISMKLHQFEVYTAYTASTVR